MLVSPVNTTRLSPAQDHPGAQGATPPHLMRGVLWPTPLLNQEGWRLGCRGGFLRWIVCATGAICLIGRVFCRLPFRNKGGGRLGFRGGFLRWIVCATGAICLIGGAARVFSQAP